jgi:hypothetical protein
MLGVPSMTVSSTSAVAVRYGLRVFGKERFFNQIRVFSKNSFLFSSLPLISFRIQYGAPNVLQSSVGRPCGGQKARLSADRPAPGLH